MMNIHWVRLFCVLLLCAWTVPVWPSTEEEHHDGVDLIRASDWKQVPARWLKRVRALDPQAMLEVARAYETGSGVPKDLNRATEWYLRAIDMGSKAARAWYDKESALEVIPAVIYEKGCTLSSHSDDESKVAAGLALIRRAADAGYALAEQDLGKMLFSGERIPKDWSAAHDYLKRAAVHGNQIEANHRTFAELVLVHDDEAAGFYNPMQAYYYMLLASKVFPGHYTTDWAKKYDKLTLEEKAMVRKKAARWKEGSPFWEAPPFPTTPTE